MRNVWLGMGSLAAAAVLAGAAFRYGMFFDEAFYRLEWTLCLAGLLTAGIAGWRSMRRTKGLWDGLRDISPAVPGLLPAALLYGFALLHEPASVLGCLQQALRYSAYAAFMLLLQVWFGSGERRVWLGASLHASGLFVAGCALAGWMGAVSFPSMILTTGDARLSAVGARLAGVVQYPNFMGAVACAYLVWCLLLLVRARTAWMFILSAAGVLPYLLVGLLTESRGAWLTAAAAWVAGCALLRGRERFAWLLYGGWTLLCGAAAYRTVVGAGLRGPANGSGGGATAAETALLLIFCVAAPAGLFVLRLLVRRGGRDRLFGRIAWTGWAASFAAAALLLPSPIYGRIAGGSAGYETAGARELFYRDAWRLIREAPLLGRGGDAWRSLFQGVQSQPYVGNEVHSGYLEVVLDLGLIGLLMVAAMMAALLRPAWKQDKTGLLPIGVLLLHAMIDFDMSFGYYWLLLAGWLVYYAGGREGTEAERALQPVEMRGRYRGWRWSGAMESEEMRGRYRGWRGNGATESSNTRRWYRERCGNGAMESTNRRSRYRERRGSGAMPGTRAALLAAACVCFAAASVLDWRFDAAARHREAAAAVSGAARTAALRAALEANPYWTRIRLELAAQAPPPERAALLAAGLRWEPQSVPLLWALGRQSAERKDVRGAASYMRRALDVDRFDRDKQTEAVVTMARLAQTMRAASRFEEARLAADAAEAFFASYETLDRRYTANGRRFSVTPAAKSAAEQSRLLTARLETGDETN